MTEAYEKLKRLLTSRLVRLFAITPPLYQS
jgi:hypothetical protein